MPSESTVLDKHCILGNYQVHCDLLAAVSPFLFWWVALCVGGT